MFFANWANRVNEITLVGEISTEFLVAVGVGKTVTWTIGVAVGVFDAVGVGDAVGAFDAVATGEAVGVFDGTLTGEREGADTGEIGVSVAAPQAEISNANIKILRSAFMLVVIRALIASYLGCCSGWSSWPPKCKASANWAAIAWL